jgi:hypothetical protein
VVQPTHECVVFVVVFVVKKGQKEETRKEGRTHQHGDDDDDDDAHDADDDDDDADDDDDDGGDTHRNIHPQQNKPTHATVFVDGVCLICSNHMDDDWLSAAFPCRCI